MDNDIVCRGSRALGTACGKCRRCYRECQDAWLAIHSIAYQIRQNGWDGNMCGSCSPTFADVRDFILPDWQGWFEEFFIEEKLRGN